MEEFSREKETGRAKVGNMDTKKCIDEIELYKIWRYVSHVWTWEIFRNKYLDAGWVIYRIDSE